MHSRSTLIGFIPYGHAVIILLLLVQTSCLKNDNGPRMCFTCDSRDIDVGEREAESMACPDLKFKPFPEMLTECPETYSCVTVIFLREDIEVASKEQIVYLPAQALITKRFCSIWGYETCKHFSEEMHDQLINCTICHTNLCNAPPEHQGKCNLPACKQFIKSNIFNVFLGLSYLGAILCTIEILLIVSCVIAALIRRCMKRNSIAGVGSNSQQIPNRNSETPPVELRLPPNMLRLTATSHEFHRSCSQLRALQRPYEFINN